MEHLSDRQLIEELDNLVYKEHQSLIGVLEHLIILEELSLIHI